MKHTIWNTKVKLLLFLLLAVFSLSLAIKLFHNYIPGLKANKVSAGYRSPQIYIYGGNSGFSSAGLITLASTDTPEVQIGGYNISGSAEISMYKADLPSLLDYLTHDKDNKQTKGSPNVSNFQFIATTQHDINTSTYAGSAVNLPFSETGIWYLKVKIGSTEADAFVLRSNTGVLAKQGNGEFVFWGQDFKTKRSVNGGSVEVYNLKDGQNVIQTADFDSTGIAKASLSRDADIALTHFGDDVAIVPLNLRYLNMGGSWFPFAPPTKQTKYFTFTDRPVYKPGDTVFYKSVLRDDDDARYSIPTGTAKVKIYFGGGQDPLLDKDVAISADGTIAGEYQIPESSKTGYYSLSVSAGSGYGDSTSFDVEFYQKPEFFIDVTAPKTELIAGDASSFKVTGTYFSGQPLVGQKIKYKITASDFYEYDFLTDAQNLSRNLSDDYRYAYWYGSHTVAEGTNTLNDKGEATVTFPSKMDFNQGKSQVFSIEATIDDSSQTPSFSRKNILVYAGQFGIYRSDNSYGGRVNTQINLPVSLTSNLSPSNLSGINLTAKVHRENWIAYRDPTQKYLAYKKEEEDLPDVSAKTDSKGNATISFTPSKLGSYRLTVQGNDSKGNLVAKIFYEYISDTDQPAYTPQGDAQLTISADKQKYNPVDTVRLDIYSAVSDRDVFLSFERGRMDRFQIVHLSGKNGTAEVSLVASDIPNMYAKVSSFSDGGVDSNVIDIPVSSTGKRVLVDLTPNSKKYGPGDNVNLEVSTKDGNGNPVSADVAVWAVDKAIFELSDSNLGDIFDTFWQERYDNTQEAHSLEGIVVNSGERGGGCFAQGTKVLMANGTAKNIEDVVVGDYILTKESSVSTKLVKAKVVNLQNAEDNGYLIINNNLKITPDHILFVNGSWVEAGSIQRGDRLLDKNGNALDVNTIEWQMGKVKVYNLDVENYHTFFANGLYVHNQKGGERSAFKDTAYWNPGVHTDSSGKAQITFKLPDNLTTWTIAAVADTSDTKVGQTTEEIIVSKDIIVRPILPNILRTGDMVELSALVQNFSDKNHSFNVKLAFDSGNVASADYSKVSVKSNSMERLFWQVKPEKLNDSAKLTFSAVATDDKNLSDTVIQTIPVKPFEFEEKKGESGFGNKTFSINLSPDIDKAKTGITLSLSSSMLGTLPSAMRYLINYPYGCVEQITSTLTPALVAKANQTFFADAVKGKNLTDIINKGVAKLENKQDSDGGWTWWFTGSSNPFISAYVLDNLIYAKQLGYKVDQSVLDQAKNYFEMQTFYDSTKNSQAEFTREEWVVKDYALALLDGSTKAKKLDTFDGLSPDMLSMLVMANYLNGDKNPDTNGLTKLESLANKQGDAAYWNSGEKLNFGSKDASTAFAIRAIVLAKGDTDIARQGALYLVRNRQFDYWSNTFATSQVIRAIVNLSKSQNDLNPNFSYSVNLDGVGITSGQITNANQSIKDIDIPVAKIKSTGSAVEVKVSGQGELYSTLLLDEFHTDKNAEAKSSGLSIKREYLNEKGEEYSLAPGDSVTVKLTVSGLKTNENYAVITDELPAGMVPVNPKFNNEQYGENNVNQQTAYFSSAEVRGMDVTQNGAVLSVYELTPGSHTYTYRARVVSTGTFAVPPAMVSLMYAPEIYGRSDAQVITVGKTSVIIPAVVIKQIVLKCLPIAIVALILTTALVLVVIYLTKIGFFGKIKNRVVGIFKKKGNSPPHDPPPPTVQ